MEIRIGETPVLIDDEDFGLVSGFSWFIFEATNTKYAQWKHRNGRSMRMHRLILNAPAGMVVDHINGNGLDNRKSNLRICTQQHNLANMKIPSRNTSGYKGVHWDKKRRKWAAKISFNNKTIHIGRFTEKDDAARAYNAKAVELFGEYAKENVIP